MKAIINGKRYNTEAPNTIAVAEYSSSGSRNDFQYYKEALFRTGKGSWFLAGEGHGMTKYAGHYGNMSGWGSSIIPLSKDDALAWLERNNEFDAIEKYFASQVCDA